MPIMLLVAALFARDALRQQKETILMPAYNGIQHTILSLLLMLSGCGSIPQLTFDDARATAQLAECWPGNGQTPLPAVVTPLGGFVATPAAGLPTPTMLPTTTPYPRCTAEPAAPTLIPYPTAGPTRAPYPTRLPFAATAAEQATTILHLSETVLQVDIATHPAENWPAVIAIAAPLVADDSPRVFVRAFNPRAQRWSSAQSLGSAGSGIARTRFRTAQIGIAGDGSILAVWGIVNAPRFGLMASISRDYGETWSIPVAIVSSRTHGVRDLAVTPDGQVAVLAISAAAPQHPLLIRRTAAGVWQQPEIIPVPAWYGSDGALVLLGEGDTAQVVVATSGGGGSSPDATLFLGRRTLSAGAWRIERRTIPSLDQHASDILTHLDAIRVGEYGILVSLAMIGRAAIYAVTSLDAGQSWGEPKGITISSSATPPYLALAADGNSGSAAMIWTCCSDATFVAAEATHYASWGNPLISGWPEASGTLRHPLVTGALAAADTASAQAPNSSQVWLAWVEQVHQVRVRAMTIQHIQTLGEVSR